jgi:hypothetical protein
VKLTQLLLINGLVFIGLGIAFALYGPVMMALLGVLELSEGGAGLYWYAASFARLFGAALFGFGFLIWAVRSLAATSQPALPVRRIVAALLLANMFFLFVTAIQQFSIWSSPGGWVLLVIFLLLLLGYGYILIVPESRTLQTHH